MAAILPAAGAETYKNTTRGGVTARRYTFNLKPKIEELLAKTGELEKCGMGPDTNSSQRKVVPASEIPD